MSDTFKIVPLSHGHFRVENQRQSQAPRALRIDYIVTPTDNGTHRVTLVGPDREHPEMLGEFSTVEDANEFVRRMREFDAGPSHGGNP